MRMAAGGRIHQRTHGSERLVERIGFPLLIVLLVALALAGGASRPDALGQALVRAIATFVLIAAALSGELRLRYRTLWALLIAAATLLIIQLVPLPPMVWQSLPGRAFVRDADALLGDKVPWRPLSLVPDGTLNALFSLIVPLAVLALLCMGSGRSGRASVNAVFVLILASSGLALLQILGAIPDNPFINETDGAASGFLANRNHQALMLAVGMVVAPGWALLPGKVVGWRVASAAAAVMWLGLMILVTGSRAGIILILLALMFDMALVQAALKREKAARWLHARPWRRFALPVVAFAMAAALIGLSLIGNRALSFDRLADLDAGEDVRVRALPVVWQMVRDYFPSGAGGGAFEPLFRLHEPFALLKPTYFNHAHDDFLELLVEHGIAGAVLVLAGLAWVVRLSVGVWRGDGRVEEVFRGRLGSAVILLMLVASITDYPLRTPLVMAILVLAAAWLADGGRAAKLYRAAG